MAKKFRDLVAATMSPEQQERARRRTLEKLAELPLYELRHARELTQATLAETLEMDQGNVSKLERKADMYVSTLRRYVEAMGGELVVVARFPEGTYKISNFSDLDEAGGKNRATPAQGSAAARGRSERGR